MTRSTRAGQVWSSDLKLQQRGRAFTRTMHLHITIDKRHVNNSMTSW
jgi:hypothetical protein